MFYSYASDRHIHSSYSCINRNFFKENYKKKTFYFLFSNNVISKVFKCQKVNFK